MQAVIRARPTDPAVSTPPRWSILALCGVIGCAVFAAYSNVLNAPFLFDDQSAIVRNPSIRNLGSWDIFSAPLKATGATGRPLVNFSLALNYAAGGLNIRGYHLFNIGVHLASTWLLLGLVRRTLLSSKLFEKWGRHALTIAAFTAALWALHPLQTESVACIIQRTELLGGFFLLLTLYCFVRSVQTSAGSAGTNNPWAWGAIGACAFGVTAKEFMAVAPLIVLLYDRTFVAGNFREAWQRRRTFYLGLGASWLILAAVLSQNPQRNENVGFGLGMSAWDYSLTQCHAILIYFKLSIWPRPLVLDYGTPLITRPGEVWWQAAILITLFGGTIQALWTRPVPGFIGAWFFIILAPSSSFIPLTTQTIAEHRMYLPLIAVLVVVICALWQVSARSMPFVCCLAATAAGMLTWQRNQDYANAISIWSDTAHKAPENHRAHYNLANAFAAAGRFTDAVPSYEAALKLRPNESSIQHNLATVLAQLGRFPEAIMHYQIAVKIDPQAADIHINLATAFAQVGQLEEAIAHYRKAGELEPKAADIHASLAYALQLQGRTAESIQEYRAALQLDPTNRQLRDALNEILRGQAGPQH